MANVVPAESSCAVEATGAAAEALDCPFVGSSHASETRADVKTSAATRAERWADEARTRRGITDRSVVLRACVDPRLERLDVVRPEALRRPAVRPATERHLAATRRRLARRLLVGLQHDEAPLRVVRYDADEAARAARGACGGHVDEVGVRLRLGAHVEVPLRHAGLAGDVALEAAVPLDDLRVDLRERGAVAVDDARILRSRGHLFGGRAAAAGGGQRGEGEEESKSRSIHSAVPTVFQ